MKDKKQLIKKKIYETKKKLGSDFSCNQNISHDRSRKNNFFKYLFIFLIGLSFSLFFTNAFTLVKTNITNAVQVIKRTYFTNDGTLSGTTIVDINAGSGYIYIKTGTINTGNGTILGINNSGYIIVLTGSALPTGPTGFLSAGITGATPFYNGSTWITGSTNIYNTGGNIGIGTNTPTAKLQVSGSIIGGISNGIAPADTKSAIVGGFSNSIGSAISSLIGGGEGNTIGAGYGFIGGGKSNTVSGLYGTIGGGDTHTIGSIYGFIGGGKGNSLNGNNNTGSSIVGGEGNSISGSYSMIPGGKNNIINGNYSFAGGQNANAIHNNTFVRNDSSTSFSSTISNTFLINASNGVGINTNNPLATLDIEGNLRIRDVLVDNNLENILVVDPNNNNIVKYIDKNSLGSIGPQGVQGTTGATGPTGANGATGFLTAGITGATPFYNGSTWITGNTNIFNTGGNIGIGITSPTSKLDLNGDLRVRTVNYDSTLGKILGVDLSGNVKWISGSVLGGAGGVFILASNILQENPSNTNVYKNDFVIGSSQLNNAAGTGDDSRMFFDKSKGSLRAGSVDSTQRDDTNIGISSIVFGTNNTGVGIYSTIGGGRGNNLDGTSDYSFIGGGTTNSITLDGQKSFIGGGEGNTIINSHNVIGGGLGNSITSQRSIIGGGWGNSITQNDSIIGGGTSNTINGINSFIGGGEGNLVAGQYSFIGGGSGNSVLGNSSFAGGGNAQAIGYAMFVRNGNPSSLFSSSQAGSFLINAPGKVGINTPSPTAAVDISGDLRIRSVTNDNALTKILGIDTNGLVKYISGTSLGGGAGTGVFILASNILQENTSNANVYQNDFVIGSSQLNNVVGTGDDSRMYFYKSFGIFRAGGVDSTQWDTNNIGNYSSAFGWNNMVGGAYSSVVGGSGNTIGKGSDKSFIGGGEGNTIDNGSTYSVIPGGLGNTINNASYSFAGGVTASAQHSNTFVRNGRVGTTFTSQKIETFIVNAPGGVGIKTNNPSADLDVNGTLRIGSTTISGSLTGILAIDPITKIVYSIDKNTLGGGLSAGITGATPFWYGGIRQTMNTNIYNTGGNVGIGINSPTSKLDINGDLKIRTVGYDNTITKILGINGSSGVQYLNKSDIINRAPVQIFEWDGNNILRENNNSNGNAYRNNFVIGSPQLNDDSNQDHFNRMFFDKTKGAFRAGSVYSTQWDTSNIGIGSIAFGYNNTTQGDYSSIGGGINNSIVASDSVNGVIAGGSGNSISGRSAYSVIGGGESNSIASASLYSIIPGGYNNHIDSASDSFVAGKNATSSNDNTFVWNGDINNSFSSQQAGTFSINTTNGVGINTANYRQQGPVALNINDTLRLAPRSGDPFTCDSAHEGTMYYSSDYHYYCFCQGPGDFVRKRVDAPTMGCGT